MPPLEQIRHQLLANIHLGLLPPGSRLPAVRELATSAGLNLKTAFRIYRGLAGEGLVEIRPQRGVFVKYSGSAGKRTHRASVQSFLDRVVREGQRHNLAPVRVAQMLASRQGVPDGFTVRAALLECNDEQTGVFSAELRRRLGIVVVPVRTDAPTRQRERGLRQADVFITTYYHRDEVSHWAGQHHKEAFFIRLNPEFHRMLLRYGRRGLFPLIMSDVSYEPRFRRVMSRLMPASVLERLELVNYRRTDRVRALLQQVRHAYVSPLVYDEVSAIAPKSVELITLPEMISRESIQHLRRELLLTKS